MDLLSFARGPALTFAMAIFVIGVLWRLVGVLSLPAWRDDSPPRKGAPPAWLSALQAILGKMIPHKTFLKEGMFTTVNGYVFHIGLAICVFAFAPHILFLKSLFGFGWPALPNGLIYAAGVVTAGSLLAALVYRVASPVLRLISRGNDYISWALTFLPVVTGLAASSHIGARYETLLALHILSICVFLIWFPFGKLMHAFLFVFSRGATGIRFGRRGAQL
jgi:nitrate reductase gamma subunit